MLFKKIPNFRGHRSQQRKHRMAIEQAYERPRCHHSGRRCRRSLECSSWKLQYHFVKPKRFRQNGHATRVIQNFFTNPKIKNFLFSADLVPVFSFGENDLFIQVDNPEGSLIRKLQVSCFLFIALNNLQKIFFQLAMKAYLGYSPALFHGRGIFNYTFGILPYRKPIYTVGESKKNFLSVTSKN